jgi:MOSC domain-containing protein YiiM
MKIVSLNIGKKTAVQWRGKTYDTGIFKSKVKGPLFLDVKDVRNDIVIDRKHHGGVDQAVYAYGYNHYAYWRTLYPSLQLDFGYMGENLTVSELEETKIHIGDIYRLGEAVVQVTKPRQPCFKLGIRFNDQRIVKQFWDTTKSGVYFRILQTGNIAIGDEFLLIKKIKNSPTIADIFVSKRA